MAKVCIGIDLGGTFTKFGLLDERRRPSGIFQLPTPTDGAEAIIERMAEGARKALADAGVSGRDVAGVGVGSPGPLSMSKGIVYAAPNLPGFVNLRLRQRLSRKLDGLPVALENDANAAGYGEFLCGAGRKCRDMVLLTLGTGVGGGVVVDGKVLRGSHEIGAELGHMILVPDGRPCGCGQRGCLEQYCSATFMSRWAARELEATPRRSRLRAVMRAKAAMDPPQELDARDINAARKAGDAFAARVWDEMARHLATACVNFARALDPDRIVLAGGMAKAGRDLLAPVQEHYRDLHWGLTPRKTAIALATLGNDAGVIGAAGIAWAEFAS